MEVLRVQNGRNPNLVCKLNKYLYILKQSSRAWSQMFNVYTKRKILKMSFLHICGWHYFSKQQCCIYTSNQVITWIWMLNGKYWKDSFLFWIKIKKKQKGRMDYNDTKIYKNKNTLISCGELQANGCSIKN